MRKTCYLLFYLLSIPLISGCWDQDDLNNRRIINGLSFDVSENDPELIKGSVKALLVRGSGWGDMELYDDITSSERKTVSEIAISLQNKIPGNMDIGKTNVIMVGKELAQKKGIIPLIEPIFRSQSGYLASKLIITNGNGRDILSIQNEVNPIIFEILKLVENGEKQTFIPQTNTFEIWNTISDNKRDVIIPLIDSEKGQLILSGVALFNQGRYTGYDLSINQTAILLALMGELENTNVISVSGHNELTQPLTIGVKNERRNMNVFVDNSGIITCDINVTLKAKVMSYYGDNSEGSIETLNKIASSELTEKAKNITKILLDANSDALGIAREISTFHPHLWDRLNWNVDYSNIKINPKITVEIYNSTRIE